MLMGRTTRSGNTALPIETVAARVDRSKNLCYGAKNSRRWTADQVPLRLGEMKGSGMGSNKKATLVLSVLIIVVGNGNGCNFLDIWLHAKIPKRRRKGQGGHLYNQM
jgi:hypothetical protein